jgi:membrane glycosyltransferase
VWRSQGREDAETSWREALRQHGFDSLFASVWGATLFWLNPGYFFWVTPIVGALILSVPTSVLASRVRLGDRARRRRLFLIPEESDPPHELRDLYELHATAKERLNGLEAEQDGFVRAVVDPYVNAVHRALLGKPRSLTASIREARAAMMEKALAEGPRNLDSTERRILLLDPEKTTEIHRRVWNLSDRVRARRWGRPGPRDERA